MNQIDIWNNVKDQNSNLSLFFFYNLDQFTLSYWFITLSLLNIYEQTHFMLLSLIFSTVFRLEPDRENRELG